MSELLNYNTPSPAERRAALLKKIRRWALRTLLILFILASVTAIIDQAWVWYWRRITIDHNTTRIASPIEPNGRPDYLAAINAQYAAGVTADNNAAPLLLQIVGSQEEVPTV